MRISSRGVHTAWSHTPGTVTQADPVSLLQYVHQQLGRREVAKRLRVSEEEIDSWLATPAEMPNRKRLALADLVQELTDPGHGK
jgi:hypothetical protein